ncbi:MAG: uncharacterized protein A8A55_2790 [Amphiamblys sp. WSBS2006]|nr:MAG: uncharacterized protein A8A55_2790 [Amphiamblys sp. WSBS2006]
MGRMQRRSGEERTQTKLRKQTKQRRRPKLQRHTTKHRAAVSEQAGKRKRGNPSGSENSIVFGARSLSGVFPANLSWRCGSVLSSQTRRVFSSVYVLEQCLSPV